MNCDICDERVGDSSVVVLNHLLSEHLGHDDVKEFLREMYVVERCRRCGDRFEADTTLLPESSAGYVFLYPEYCPDCREGVRGGVAGSMKSHEAAWRCVDGAA